MPHLRNRHLVAVDAVLLLLTAALAFAVRFETVLLPGESVGLLGVYVALAVPTRLVALYMLGLYGRLWRYAGQADLEVLCVAGLTSAAVGLGVGALAGLLVPAGWGRVPLSVLALDGALGVLALAVPRFAVRESTWSRRGRAKCRRVLVVGAGNAGALIARELLRHRAPALEPVAFVDDDPLKQNRRLQGVPIVGTLDAIASVVRREAIDEIVIAMPSAAGAVVRRVLKEASAAGVPTRTVPGLYELVSGRKAVNALRRVEIEDLLRRAPVQTDLARVRMLAQEKVVAVTGAGGSIGGELCRQIARLRPARLLAIGRGENSVFELLNELKRDFPDVVVEPVIADVRDRVRLERVFREARPATVFHAAAHKHVPLMEQNVAEAILNNVLGTKVVAELAAKYGAQHFVLISSDKAVRPSSVMGATKRLAEGVVQQVGERSTCRFMSVRFGNVLGSRGSVIPTFLRQIQHGGPITITHPEMRRYFMTIPEAVQLVLQAGAMGDGGEVFVLDMGEPVRVLDLARDLVRLSGLVEGQDVEIRFTGVRPGEKLYEELFFNHENASPTEHPKVLRARNASLDLAGGMSLEQLISLAAHDAASDDLRRGIKSLVPEYTGVQQPVGPVGAVGTSVDVALLASEAVESANGFPLDQEAEADAALAGDLTAAGVTRGSWGGAGLRAEGSGVRPTS